ncbi:methylated-DNA--[protein]-cysteine S-methyltransferase [Trinickia caryophylli]|uniref:Methylated-DNA-[protein]-cysteine S-methyltransferase n=1 Tax=Trinickia caryophylli TaxID=28094 RepID=A0A1X7H266_TRICW|nr:methylated-DNA--[protein]-cysteine S-methyltransferase [Trinickia caryophylli]PMS10020.1 methylated-DNA--[protein]-cysteine S-methyltransferase [Trinickia caryophylli]TRX18377.1 methylated-DNA--[protein]-cysteine S-methyltransferase [Trinickia caryophylli]WQE10839.1 methylated-DNA--[protein]-cysteine S-methyltransferase [Trinickia caryophylli]SMF78315.1 methylated-DNA-[protein]-cysteine S-methyltransferase [Trinickia caryophylli]GLU35481.1 methylated-DNA--protein-cysteine methyltransferase 
MHNVVIAAPFGKVGIDVDDAAGVVRLIEYLPHTVPDAKPQSELARCAARQIERYFAESDAPFDLPLADVGTAFQRRVWAAIRAIPAGSVQTYGELARAAGGAVPRAVGQACGDNPFPIVIPCHRVVAAQGLGGFAHHAEDGFHLRVKRWLLAHESAQQALAL